MTKEELDKLAEAAFDADNQRRLSKSLGLEYLKQLHTEVSKSQFYFIPVINGEILIYIGNPGSNRMNPSLDYDLSHLTPTILKNCIDKNIQIGLQYEGYQIFTISQIAKQGTTYYEFTFTYYGTHGLLIQLGLKTNLSENRISYSSIKTM
ncbi:MAG: hypothetical protein LUH10_15150 [Tannerellaceae bacterium]|nr:hypothetical protein [Tannerellaceae bacterium]